MIDLSSTLNLINYAFVACHETMMPLSHAHLCTGYPHVLKFLSNSLARNNGLNIMMASPLHLHLRRHLYYFVYLSNSVIVVIDSKSGA